MMIDEKELQKTDNLVKECAELLSDPNSSDVVIEEKLNELDARLNLGDIKEFTTEQKLQEIRERIKQLDRLDQLIAEVEGS
jgi:hypothetical protein